MRNADKGALRSVAPLFLGDFKSHNDIIGYMLEYGIPLKFDAIVEKYFGTMLVSYIDIEDYKSSVESLITSKPLYSIH